MGGDTSANNREDDSSQIAYLPSLFTKWTTGFFVSLFVHLLLFVLLGFMILRFEREQEQAVAVHIPSSTEKISFEKTTQKKLENPTILNEKKEETDPSLSGRPARSRKKSSDQPIGLSGNSTGETGQAFQTGVEWSEVNRSGFGKARGEKKGIQRKGGSKRTEKAVMKSLLWLAKHQAPDGHWNAYEYVEQCGKTTCERKVTSVQRRHSVGVTALSLLAFLGAGYTPKSDEVTYQGYNFGSIVKQGLKWLISKQADNGFFRSQQRREMYNHAIATLAVTEAYGMTGFAPLKRSARKAISFLENAQNVKTEEQNDVKELAWRYHPRSGDNDTSVTGWCIMALKSAHLVGFDVSPASFKGALTWVESVSNEKGLTGYRHAAGAGKLRRRAMTAVGMLVRMFVNDQPDTDALRNSANYLLAHKPEWEKEGKRYSMNPIDYYYWYYGTLALYLYAGPDESVSSSFTDWIEWNKAMKTVLVNHQQTEEDEHEHGSWDPVSRWSKFGGRVYATALNTLTLEVYYRFETTFGIGD